MAHAAGRSNPSCRRRPPPSVVAGAVGLLVVVTTWLAAAPPPARSGNPRPTRAARWPSGGAEDPGDRSPSVRSPGAAPGRGLAGAERPGSVAVTSGGSPAVLRAGPMAPGFDLDRIVKQVHFALREEGGAWTGGHATHEVRLAGGGLHVTPLHHARAGAAAAGRGGARVVRGEPVAFGAARIARGGRLLFAGEGAPAPTSDGQLDLHKGAVVEELRNTAAGVEQRWSFAESPEGRGDLEIRVPVSGGAYLDATAGGLHFAAGDLGIRYGHGTWVDGLGLRTPVPARWDDGAVVLRVPAAVVDGSTFPAVLDPIISGELEVDVPVFSGAATRTLSPAVAWSGTRYLVAWLDQRNGASQVFAARVDPQGVVEDRGGIAVSTPGLEAADVDVASNGADFLLAWQDAGAGNGDLRGARVSGAGALLDPGGFAIATTSNIEGSPAVAWAGGTYLVAWYVGAGRSNLGVRAARVTGSGTIVDKGGFVVTSSPARSPAIASDGTGFLVAWSDGRGVDWDIYATAVGADATVLQPSGIVVGGATGHQDRPAITWAGTEWFVAWEDYRTGGIADIYGARVTAGGVVSDPAGIPICTATSYQLYPRVAYDGSQVLVAWMDQRSGVDVYAALSGTPATFGGVLVATDRNDVAVARGADDFLIVMHQFSGTAIDAARMTSAGLLDAQPFAISGRANREQAPAIAFDGTTYLIVWEDQRAPGTWDVYGARVDAAGNQVGDLSGIQLSTSGDARAPSVAWADGAAAYLVAWSEGATGDVVGSARVDAAGTVLGRAALAVAAPGFAKSGVSVAASDTSFLVAWEDHRAGAGDSDVLAALVSGSGEVLNGAIPVVTWSGDQLHPSAASEGADFLVVWDDAHHPAGDGHSGVAEIRAMRVAGAGGALLDATGGIAVSVGGGLRQKPAVAWGLSSYLVAWEDWRSTYGAIYAARVAPSGLLLDAGGVSVTNPFAVGAVTRTTPSVAWDGSEWLVVWGEAPQILDPIWSTRAAAVLPDGTVPQLGGFLVASGEDASARTAVAAAGLGNFLLARQRSRLTPELDVARIAGRRFSNVPPVAIPQSVTTPEDTAVDVTLAGSDADGDDAIYGLAFAVGTPPAHGVLSGTPPLLRYTPDANFNGDDAFTFRAGDGMSFSGWATVRLVVTPVNDAPVAYPATGTAREDTPVTLALTGVDVEASPISFVLERPPAHGALDASGFPDVVYTPAPDYFGADSFSFRVSDGEASSAPAVVSITVAPVNDAPVAFSSIVTTAEDTNVGVTLLAADVEGAALTYALRSAPIHGLLSGTAPALVYRPDRDFNGTDSFAFDVFDGELVSNLATVTVAVEAVNDAPIATPLTPSTQEDTPIVIALAGTDVDGDPLTFTTVTLPQHGTLVEVEPGKLLYTPDPNYSGPDGFRFRAFDGRDPSADADVTIYVVPVNDAPVAAPQAVQVDEDSVVDLVLGGLDTEGSPLTSAIVTYPAHGTLTGTPPAVRYAPGPDYAGTDAFTFRVNDGALDSAPATVSITVRGVNDAPSALAQSVSAVEDTPVALTLAGADVDGDALAFEILTQPGHGTLSGSPPRLTYQSAPNYHGPDSFTFLAADAGGLTSGPATVSIVVAAVNDPPSADPQVVNATEDAPASFTVTGSDPDGDALTFAVVAQPAHGTVSTSGATFTYVPAADFNGTDTFTFRASDGAASSDAATVTVNVAPVNDPPVATPQTVTVEEDQPRVITLGGADVDGDPLTVTVVTAPTHGTLGQSGATVTYTPAPDYAGPDTFTFRVNDGRVDSAPAAVEITMTPVNDAPVASARGVTLAEDGGPIDVVVTATDVDGDPLTYYLVSPPAHGTVTVSGATFTYTPARDFSGSDAFSFRANDGRSDSATATVSVTVTPVNDVPIAFADVVITPEDTVATLTLGGSDADGDALVFSVATFPAHGVLAQAGAKVFYTPDPDHAGTDAFTFHVSDGVARSAPATVSITVTPVNDAPVALARSATVTEDSGPNVIVVSARDADADPLTYALATPPSHGSVTVSGATFTYTPAPDYSGPDAFTFVASDGLATSPVPAAVSVTVTPVNDAPVALPQTLAAAEDGSGTATLAAIDVDGDPLTFAVASLPEHGTVTITGGTATYVPRADYFGPDVFTVVASDGAATSAPAAVTVTVTPVNDPPTATAQAVSTAEDAPVAITLAGTDVEGSALTFALVVLPAHGTLTGSGARLVYTPARDFAGADVFTFKVNDGSLDSAPATVSLSVTGVQDAPVATPQSPTVAEDSVLSLTLSGTDPDGDALTFRIVSQPAHGALAGAPPNLSYTPDPDYNGTDLFSFVVNDGTSDSPPAAVAVAVLSVNDAPVAVAKSVTVDEGRSAAVALEGTDVDGQSLAYAIVTSPAHGTVSGAAPNLIYTPAAGFAGADSFTYRVSDGMVSSAAVTVSITVSAAGAAAEGTESVLGCTTGTGRAGGGATALLLAGLAIGLSRRSRPRAGIAGALLIGLCAPALVRAAADLSLPPPPAATSRTPLARAPASAGSPAPKGLRVAVLPIRAGLGVEPKLADLVTDALVAELADRGLKTITSKDVEAALGFERQKQMLGCSSDTSCLAEIAGALGADRVVFGDISMVRELTVFSAQVLNPRSGAVEHRFHERMTGGDTQDLLDATERAGAELFPGTKRSGTASRRKSVLTGTDRPLSVVLRGGADVQDPGGLAALLAEFRLSRTVRLAAGPAMGGKEAFGGAIRAGWYPVTFSRVSLFAAVEGVLLFPGDTVFAVAPGLGVEVALSHRITLAAEAPLLILASAPKQYRTIYFVPSLSVAFRF